MAISRICHEGVFCIVSCPWIFNRRLNLFRYTPGSKILIHFSSRSLELKAKSTIQVETHYWGHWRARMGEKMSAKNYRQFLDLAKEPSKLSPVSKALSLSKGGIWSKIQYWKWNSVLKMKFRFNASKEVTFLI